MTSKHHVNEDKLIGYLYRTINDADREVIDDHLLGCSICRATLNNHQLHQKRIDQQIRTQINGLTSPPGMQFAGIESRLQHRGLRFTSPGFQLAIPVTTAVIGLLFAVTGLMQMINNFTFNAPANSAGAFPALACFFLMFVSMDQLDRSFTLQPKFIISVVLTVLLWLATAVLGFLNILVVRDIALILSINAGHSLAETSTAAILAVILAGIVFIVMVIGGAEYHYRHIGQPSSWKVISMTILLQLLIFFIPYFL